MDYNGEVVYGTVPEEQELEIVYLAPELQQHGVITEKVIVQIRLNDGIFMMRLW